MDTHRRDRASSDSLEIKVHSQLEHQNDERKSSTVLSNRQGSLTAAERARRNVDAKLANPLAGESYAALEEMGAVYARKHQMGDEEDIRAFQKGACLAQDPSRFASIPGLTEKELAVLERETTNRWSQPRLLYVVIVLCSTCAAVQGMGK